MFCRDKLDIIFMPFFFFNSQVVENERIFSRINSYSVTYFITWELCECLKITGTYEPASKSMCVHIYIYIYERERWEILLSIFFQFRFLWYFVTSADDKIEKRFNAMNVVLWNDLRLNNFFFIGSILCRVWLNENTSNVGYNSTSITYIIIVLYN